MLSSAITQCRLCQQGRVKRPEVCGVGSPTHPVVTRFQIIAWIIACIVVIGFDGQNPHVMSTTRMPLRNQMGHSFVPNGCQRSVTNVVQILTVAW